MHDWRSRTQVRDRRRRHQGTRPAPRAGPTHPGDRVRGQVSTSCTVGRRRETRPRGVPKRWGGEGRRLWAPDDVART